MCYSLTCPLSHQVVIWDLPDKVLLDVFSYFVQVFPRNWPTLVHICHKWRRIVFAYEQSLQLRLFCTHGTPVRTTLACWPRTLPIVVEYGGSPELDPPTLEDENDIMAALNQPDRVHSISLTITSSLLKKLSAIKRPFSKLEHLILLSLDNVQLTLPRTFRWGQRLRRLHSTRIVIPALIRSYYSSMDLQLHEVPNPWYLSRNALPDALSRMAQLRSLSLHFLPTIDHVSVSPACRNRVVFTALTRFKYRGIVRDFEDLVARIEAPRLEDIEVTFSNIYTLDCSELTGFINRIGMHKSYRQVHLLFSENAFSVSLTQPEVPTRIIFQSFCEPFSLQLSSMARIVIHFYTLLLDVQDLLISVTPQSRQEDIYYTGRWLKLLNLFEGVKWLYLVGNLSTDIVHILQLCNDVLPALRGIYIPQPGPCHVPLRQALVSFMTSRRLSGHPIAVEYEQLSRMSGLSGAGTKYAQCHRHCSLTHFR